MQQIGTRVSLRAVVGGIVLFGFGLMMWDAWSKELRMSLVGGGIGLLLVSAAGLALMYHNTRDDRARRGMGRWFLETLKLTGTLMLGYLAIFVVWRGYELLTR